MSANGEDSMTLSPPPQTLLYKDYEELKRLYCRVNARHD